MQFVIIKGKGRPLERSGNNQCGQVPLGLLLTPEEMQQSYVARGGQITDEWQFGTDPLHHFEDLQQIREQHFNERCQHSPQDLFSQVVNGNYNNFKTAILVYIEETNNLAPILLRTMQHT